MNIGIFLENIEHSQLQQSIRHLAGKKVAIYSCLQSKIYEDFNLPILGQINAFGHSGELICTSLYTLNIAINFPRVKRLIYYPWDLEWVYNVGLAVDRLKLIMNDRVELLARSNRYYNTLKRSFKTPIGIVEEFDYEQLTRTL